MKTTLEKLRARPDHSIRTAMQILNDGTQRIALIQNDEGKLLGLVTDSDIRRAILKGLSLDLPVSEIMVTKPVVATEKMKDAEILKIMRQASIHQIPIVDRNWRVIAMRTHYAIIGQKQETEVIIMAGGLSTRLQPITKHTPKPLVPVGGKPILFILLDQLILAGFQKITLALNYKSHMIKAAVAQVPRYNRIVHFLEEKKRLGTAGSLSLLKHPPKKPFLVMNADILTRVNFTAMLHFHELERNHITMAVRQEKHPVPFGVVRFNKTHVLGMEEKPVHTYFANAGIYVLNSSILDLLPKNSFYDMPDLINDVIRDGKQVGGFPVHEYWLDIGEHPKLQQAQKDVVEHFMDLSR